MEEYKDLFLAEAQEYIQTLNDCLLRLEKNPDNSDYLAEMFRAAHSLKGMAGTMGYEAITNLTHELESMLDRLRSHKLQVSTSLINLLFNAVDTIYEMVDNLDELDNYSSQVESIIEKLASWGEEGAVRPGDRSAAKDSAARDKEEEPGTTIYPDVFSELGEFEKETLKQALARGEEAYQLDVELREGSLLKSVRAYMVLKAVEGHGEIIAAIPSLQDLEEERFENTFSLLLVGKPRLQELRHAIESIAEIAGLTITPLAEKAAVKEAVKEAAAEKAPGASGVQAAIAHKMEKTVRVETAKLDNLVNLVGELIINRTRVVELGKKSGDELLENSLEQLERISTDLQNAVMKLRMVPIKQVFDRFPRMVRDLSVEKGKEVELTISGEETELDRTIVNQIGDPLVHLLRNAVDHGIESAEERERLGKDRVGKIHLEAHHEGSLVVVSVKDDGAGFNPEKIAKKALAKGLVTSEELEKMDKEEITQLIFQSGFSTSDQVTDISGRGVGMDVVKTAIEALKGSVEVKSEPGKGTEVILRLPLTLAIIRTLLVRAGSEIYAIPIEAIRENLYVEPKDIKTIQRGQVITLREEVLHLHSLQEALGMSKSKEQEEYPVVVVKAGNKTAGLIVDEMLGQQEIVIKSLSNFVNNIKGIAGATVLGDGRVTLILDVAGLLEDGRVSVGKESVNN